MYTSSPKQAPLARLFAVLRAVILLLLLFLLLSPLWKLRSVAYNTFDLWGGFGLDCLGVRDPIYMYNIGLTEIMRRNYLRAIMHNTANIHRECIISPRSNYISNLIISYRKISKLINKITWNYFTMQKCDLEKKLLHFDHSHQYHHYYFLSFRVRIKGLFINELSRISINNGSRYYQKKKKNCFCLQREQLLSVDVHLRIHVRMCVCVYAETISF